MRKETRNSTESTTILLFVVWGMMEFFYHFIKYKEGGWGPIIDSMHLNILFQAFLTLFLFICYNTTPNMFDKSIVNKNIVSSFVVFLSIYSLLNCLVLNFYGVLANIMLVIFMFLFLQLIDSIKIRIFECFINVIAIFLTLSVIEFLVFVFTGYKYVLFSDLYYGENPYDQTWFNFFPTLSGLRNFSGLDTFFRFRSLADEPGGVGTTCAFLLFATSGIKKYRFHYLVFWIAGILSFSLAFFIIAFIHLVSFYFRGKNILGFVALIVLLSIVYATFKQAFSYFVFERVSGDYVDNRSTMALDNAINSAISNGSILLPHYDERIRSAGSGVKLAVYNSGFIAILFLVIGYIKCFLKTMKRCGLTHKTACIFFFIAFWISYYQRAYILMFQYVLPYFVMPIFMVHYEKMKSQESK